MNNISPLFQLFILICIILFLNKDNIIIFLCYKHIHKLTIIHKTITLKGTIDELNAQQFILQLSSLKKKYNPVYIYIDSPGGNVKHAINIIKHMQTINNTICIAKHAASAAFTIFQSCKTRYVLKNSILMQHNTIVKLPSKLTLNSLEEMCDTGYITDLVYADKLFSKIDYKRLNITKTHYEQLVQTDWYLNGWREILKYNAADEAINYHDFMNN